MVLPFVFVGLSRYGSHCIGLFLCAEERNEMDLYCSNLLAMRLQFPK